MEKREQNQKIDEQIRREAEKEQWKLPASCEKRLEQILTELPDSITEEKNRIKLWRSRKSLLLAAALAALVGTTAMASGLFHWDQRAVENFNQPTEEEQNAMTMEGMAKEQTASVTDAGITVTAKQTVQDKNTLYILLDIRTEEAIIDGNGGFDRSDENGEYGSPWIITENEDALNNVSMGFSPDSPSFAELSDHGYYEISALKSMEQEWTENQITISFTEYSYYTYENGDTIPHTIKGNWTLVLPLGEDTMLEASVFEPQQPVEIKGIPVRVKRVELSPLSLLLTFDMDDLDKLKEVCDTGEEDIYLMETEFSGFLDRSGEELHAGMGGMSGKYDFENREIIRQIGLDTYVDTDQVKAVLLGEEKTAVELE